MYMYTVKCQCVSLHSLAVHRLLCLFRVILFEKITLVVLLHTSLADFHIALYRLMQQTNFPAIFTSLFSCWLTFCLVHYHHARLSHWNHVHANTIGRVFCECISPPCSTTFTYTHEFSLPFADCALCMLTLFQLNHLYT